MRRPAQPWPERPAAEQHEREAQTTVAATIWPVRRRIEPRRYAGADVEGETGLTGAVAQQATSIRPPALGPRGQGSKLASTVAARIVGDIARLGWPEGAVVGSEPELLERYGVSRAVFREAVRLVEHQHVARMRRGPGGGLVVTAPSMDSVADAVSVYLFYVGAEIDEMFEARLAVEEAAAGLAPGRLGDAEADQLRDLVAAEGDGRVRDHRVLHRLVAAMTGNPALEFFVDLLNRVTLLYLPRGSRLSQATLAESARAHATIAEAILAGDEAGARRRMRRHLEAEAEYLRARRPSRRRLADLSDAVGRSDKRAEADRPADLRRGHFGRLAGGRRAGVRGRAHGPLRRQPGRAAGGGAGARAPPGGPHAPGPGRRPRRGRARRRGHDRRGGTVRRPPRHRPPPPVRGAGRSGDGCARPGDGRPRRRRRRQAGGPRWRPSARCRAEEFLVVGHDLHNVLAEVSGNRVLELLSLVLTRLTPLHSAAPHHPPDLLPTGDASEVHQRIVDAIVAGDREVARRRMRRHLDALVPWVR